MKSLRNTALRNLSLEDLLSLCSKQDECFVWPFNKTRAGYGLLRLDNTQSSTSMGYAHRFVYAKAFGDFDAKLFVCHTCDNPSCVNPEHLKLGTAADNQQDMAAKNRGRKSKFCTADIAKIIALSNEGWTQKAIGSIFNVSQTTVSLIMRQKYKSYA